MPKSLAEKQMRIDIHSRQNEALKVIRETPVVLYGGARGGGKSFLVRAWMVMRRIKYPGSRGVIIRKTFPELQSNHIDRIFLEYPQLSRLYNRADKVIEFPNGSRLYFKHLQNPGDVYNFQGLEFDDIALDEAGQHTEMTFSILRASNRTTRTDLKPRFLLTGNPGGVGHCVPFGDVLTWGGWKDIKEVKEGDLVASLLGDRTIIYKKVSQLWSEDYSGELLTISQRNGVEITCTPNHKIARKIGDNYSDNRFTLTEAKDMPNNAYVVRKGNGSVFEPESYEVGAPEFVIPKAPGRVNKPQPLNLAIDDYFEFMGWYLSEGFIIRGTAAVGIAQSKPEQREHINELLSRIGLQYKAKKEQFIFYSHSWHKYLAQFGKCREKFVPDSIMKAPNWLLNIFFKTMVDGDGHWVSSTSGQYYTISEKLHNQMSEIAVRLGYVVTEYVRERKGRIGKSYQVNFSRQDSIGDCEVRKWGRADYSGKVYCIGVEDTHNFFIRQNGTVWVSGNSWLKRLFIERRFTELERPSDYAFVPSKVYDNPSIMENDPDYVHRLESLPEEQRRAYLDGDWNVFVGQFFTEFRKEKHVIDPRFDLKTAPVTWDYVLSWDEGTLRPRAVYVIAQDRDGKVEVIWEYYRTGETAVEAAQNITSSLMQEGILDILRKNGKFVYDPSMDIASNQTGLSTSKIVNSYLQMRMEPANNDRVEGARLYREYLHWDKLTDPLLRIWSTCPNLIEEIPALVYAEGRRGEDVNSESADHGFDSTRYGLMALRRPAQRLKRPRTGDPWEDEPLFLKKLRGTKKKKILNPMAGY